MGLFLTSSLDWNVQIHEVCLKANKKLSVLKGVKLLKRKTLDLLYKVTIRSVIDYALPVYANTLLQTEIARLERLQYRSAKLVTGALHYTNKDKLDAELGWESINKRIQFLGLSLFHKIHLNETRPLIRNWMSKLDIERKYEMRSKGGYIPFPNYGNKFLNSFFPYFSKLWNNLTQSTKQKDLIDFKSQLKIDLKPTKIKHFSKGPLLSNTLLTRLRVGRSDLNLHKFSIGFSDKPECICHAKEESSLHYMLDCFLYTAERRTLFSLVEHLIPFFPRMNRKSKLYLLFNGLKNDDPDYNHLNYRITCAVQTYIIHTKRFLHH